MSTLPVHKELEALAQDPFSLDPVAWRAVGARIGALVAGAASLDWSEETVESERGHVPHMRAHLYVLRLQYIAIRGTNQVMHLLRNAAGASDDLALAENIQLACHRFEKTSQKYKQLRDLLGPSGAPESHGYFLTLVESRFDDLTAELQRQRESIILAATNADVEMARREPTCEDAMKRRLAAPASPKAAPEVVETQLTEALDNGTWPLREPLPRDEDGDNMPLRVVTAYLNKLREEEREED